MVANIPDVIWTADTTGRLSFISPNIEAMCGLTVEAIGESGWISLIDPDDLAPTLESYRAMFEKTASEKGRAFDSEFRLRRKNGSIEKLKGCDATVIDAGEAIIIQTPTAGGYGKAGDPRS